jgi:negative regulator of flagellin synthesis FlgM
MKVNNLSELPASAAAAASAKAAERAVAPEANSTPLGTPASTPAAREPSVSVTLSPVTQTMTNGVARSGTDVFNAEKVQAMRTAIENGSFSVNAEAVADKLLSNAREMLSVASSN